MIQLPKLTHLETIYVNYCETTIEVKDMKYKQMNNNSICSGAYTEKNNLVIHKFDLS